MLSAASDDPRGARGPRELILENPRLNGSGATMAAIALFLINATGVRPVGASRYLTKKLAIRMNPNALKTQESTEEGIASLCEFDARMDEAGRLGVCERVDLGREALKAEVSKLSLQIYQEMRRQLCESRELGKDKQIKAIS